MVLTGSTNAFAVQEASDAIARYSDWRVVRGLSAVSEDERASAACASHLAYLKANEDQYASAPHDEFSNRPGYTSDGASYRRWEVLGSANDPTWTGQHSGTPINHVSTIWDDAPWHAFNMMDPTLVEAGFAMDDKRVCLRGSPNGFTSGPFPAVSWPHDGQTGIPTSMRVREWPWSPQMTLGWPEDLETGPQFTLSTPGFATEFLGCTAPPAEARDLRLESSAGEQVEVHLVTPSSASGPYDARFIRRGGAVVIPRQALAAHATYHFTVEWHRDAFSTTTPDGRSCEAPERTERQSFSFTTGEANAPSDPGPQPGTGPGTGPETGPDTSPAPTLSATILAQPRQRIRALLRRGFTTRFRVSLLVGVELRYVISKRLARRYRIRTTVARRSMSAVAGSHRVQVRMAGKARRRLKDVRRLPVRLKLTATAGRQVRTATRSLTYVR